MVSTRNRKLGIYSVFGYLDLYGHQLLGACFFVQMTTGCGTCSSAAAREPRTSTSTALSTTASGPARTSPTTQGTPIAEA